MTNQKQQSRKSITDTTINIDPVAVVFNVENDTIQDFVDQYVTHTSNIDGVRGVRLQVVRDGNRNPEVSLYVFIDQNSKDVFSNMGNVPKHLRYKMDTSGFKASDKLTQALRPIAKDFKLGVAPKEKLVFIKLDIFRVLGLMLSADIRTHHIQITEVVKLKNKRAVISVIKQSKFVNRDDSFDKLSNIIDRIER